MRLRSLSRDASVESITPDVDNDADRNRSQDRIGELLSRAAVLSAPQIEQIVRVQRTSGGRFGETAIELGFASREAVDRALATQFDFSIASAGESRLHPSLATARGTQARSSELIRSLRAKVSHDLNSRGPAPHVLTVMSITGHVGRRLIAANLAIAFGQANIRTIIIDADLRTPSLHRLFDAPNASGLSNYLAGRNGAPTIVPIAEIPNLALQPAGPLPPNPAELLARLPQHIEAIRRSWNADMVILNTPPLAIADDAVLVAAAAPFVLLVARRSFTRSRAIAEAAGRLAAADITVIGSVLNVA